jgi:16S rRNA (guanine966-N2)-methyltransferase
MAAAAGGAVRLVGGSHRGRRLRCPPGTATRPTSDRVREAIFDLLGAPPDATRVLDLFAGTGALGLEALSRGASLALLVESDPRAAQVVRENIASLGLTGRARLLRADVRTALRRLTELATAGRLPASAGSSAPAAAAAELVPFLPFSWVFVDPPYFAGLVEPTLSALCSAPLLAADATIVVEHDRRVRPADRYPCCHRRATRRYGDIEVSIYDHD